MYPIWEPCDLRYPTRLAQSLIYIDIKQHGNLPKHMLCIVKRPSTTTISFPLTLFCPPIQVKYRQNKAPSQPKGGVHTQALCAPDTTLNDYSVRWRCEISAIVGRDMKWICKDLSSPRQTYWFSQSSPNLIIWWKTTLSTLYLIFLLLNGLLRASRESASSGATFETDHRCLHPITSLHLRQNTRGPLFLAVLRFCCLCDLITSISTTPGSYSTFLRPYLLHNLCHLHAVLISDVSWLISSHSYWAMDSPSGVACSLPSPTTVLGLQGTSL